MSSRENGRIAHQTFQYYAFCKCTLIALLAWSLQAFYQHYRFTLLMLFVLQQNSQKQKSDRDTKMGDSEKHFVLNELQTQFLDIYSAASWFDKIPFNGFANDV